MVRPVGSSLKYHNKPTMSDNVSFPSKAEEKRYQENKLRLVTGEITELELHPRYPLVVNGALICTYVADSRYTLAATGERIVEDVKGGDVRTRLYLMKKRLVKALYGIDIYEVEM